MQYNGILKELKSLSNLNLGKIAKEGKRFRKWIQGVLDGLLLTQFTN